MARWNQKREQRSTPNGPVFFRSFCTPEEIDALSFQSFTSFPQYNPIIADKQSLIKAAQSHPDANVCLAIDESNEIIGFAILEYPDPDERWHRVGENIMMELAVIEISRPWRAMKIARDLLRLAVDHPLKEDRIFYMVGYSWTWDLDGTGIPAIKYREMMINLFESQGFQVFQTNEPNVMMRPENLFMARIGANISKDIKKRFKLVRFNLD